ncbi:hypothetical protein GGF46_001878 [Coemansia sp. RSA 552]|nr:hypothetical protein GGF46_001878 [Coemansia sp. RSA 552]
MSTNNTGQPDDTKERLEAVTDAFTADKSRVSPILEEYDMYKAAVRALLSSTKVFSDERDAAIERAEAAEATADRLRTSVAEANAGHSQAIADREITNIKNAEILDQCNELFSLSREFMAQRDQANANTEAARDATTYARHKLDMAMRAHDDAVEARDTAVMERDAAVVQGVETVRQRDEAIEQAIELMRQRDEAFAQCVELTRQRNTAVEQGTEVTRQHDAAVEQGVESAKQRDAAVQKGAEQRDAAVVQSAELTRQRDTAIEQGAELSKLHDAAVEQGVKVTRERDAVVERSVELFMQRDAAVAQNAELTRQRDAAIAESTELSKQRDTAIEQGAEFAMQRDAAVKQGIETAKQRDAAIEQSVDTARQRDAAIAQNAKLTRLRDGIVSEHTKAVEKPSDATVSEHSHAVADHDDATFHFDHPASLSDDAVAQHVGDIGEPSQAETEPVAVAAKTDPVHELLDDTSRKATTVDKCETALSDEEDHAKAKITEALQQSGRKEYGQVISLKPVGGGCISDAYVATMSTGKQLFVKKYQADPALDQHTCLRMFSEEMAGLQALRQTNTIRVPEPLYVGTLSNGAFLLTEHVEMKRLRNQAKLGEQLAALHLVRGPDKFGFDHDNWIGSTPQLNGWHDHWVDLLRLRLKFQFSRAQFSGKTQHRASQLLERLPEFFADIEVQPSLIHGDLWSGNCAADRHGNPVIFDPAAYWGHHEAELGIMRMFGGYGPEFYSAYHQRIPKAPGFERRAPVYELYHTVNHYNLFGAGYLGQCQHLLEQALGD